MNKKFNKDEINKAFQILNDCMDDIEYADYQNYDNQIEKLFYNMEHDKVLNIIHQQFIKYPIENFNEWLVSQKTNRHQFNLPLNSDKRLTTSYKLLWEANKSKNNSSIVNFLLMFFQKSTLDEIIDDINNKIIRELKRELEYRIEEIQNKIKNDSSDEVSEEILAIFPVVQINNSIVTIIENQNNINKNINISGDVTDSSVISHSKNVNIKDADKLMQELLKIINEDISLSAEQIKEIKEKVNNLNKEFKKDKPDKNLIINTISYLGDFSSIASFVAQLGAMVS